MAIKDINHKADDLAEEAKKCFASHDLEKATVLLDKLAQLAETNAIGPLPLTKATNTRGLIYLRRSDYKNAEKQLLQSLEYAKQVGDPVYIHGRYDNLAIIYSQSNQLRKSVEYLELSRQLKEQTGNEKDMHVTLLNLSGRYMAMGNIEAAEKALTESFFYLKKYKYKDVYSAYYFGLGQLFETKGIHKESLSAYGKSAKYALQFKDFTTAAKAYANQGSEYMMTSDWAKAKVKFTKAVQIAKEHKLRGVDMMASIHLSTIALEQGDLKRSRELYEYVQANTEPADFTMLHRDLEELKARLNEAEGNYKTALEAYKKYLVHYRKQFDNETTQSIQNLQAKYEAEKKIVSWKRPNCYRHRVS